MGTSLIYNCDLDFITTERASAMAQVISARHDLVLKYTSAWDQGILCEDETPLVECDALILGSIMKSIKASKLVAEDQGMSILELRDEIRNLRLTFFPKFKCTASSTSCQRVYACYSTPETSCECGCVDLRHDDSHSDTCSPMPELLNLIDGFISSVSGMNLEALGRMPMKGPEWEAADIR